MTDKIYLATDLGPGDGGKGSVVHWISTAMKAHTVIKRGGAQGSHGVRNSHGESFNFSQWGCGTLEAVPTFLSDQMVIMPVGLINEAYALQHACGINDAFSLLQVDKSCICATPYHKISSRIKELARGNSPRGTIGTGVGESYRYAQDCPELTIRASDLTGRNLRDKLASIRARITQDLRSILKDSTFLQRDRSLLQDNIALLRDDAFLDHIADLFHETGQKIRFATLAEILQRDGTAVVECSHGVLTDAECGFRPHTSAIRTLPRFTISMLRDAGFTGQIVSLGIHRAYTIRHGAGPLPTADPAMSESLLPGSHKDTNRWQGSVRVGALDLELLRYALNVSNQSFDGLCLTWFDQIVKNGKWKICTHYKQLISRFTTGNLSQATPTYQTHIVPSGYTREMLFDWCSSILAQQISTPLRFVSFGATELDKICK